MHASHLCPGSEHVARFRSPPEFIPHAYWLMTDPTGDRTNCHCKYCTKLPQRDISDAFGLTQLRAQVNGLMPKEAHLPTRDLRREIDKERRRTNRRELQRVFANVRCAPKPVKIRKGPKEFVIPEREKDLRALLSPKQLVSRRWVREGELIWIKLDVPIVLGPSSEETILFWPGLIEDIHFKAVVAPKGADKGKQPAVANGSEDQDERIPWKLTHMWLYKIRLLVVSKTVFIGDDHILPYQSHAPDNQLLTLLQSVEIDPGPPRSASDSTTEPPPSSQPSGPSLASDSELALLKNFEAFDPFPAESPNFNTMLEREEYFKSTIGAYTMAIQIAARITSFWTPSDEWEVRQSLPAGNARRASAFSSAARGELALEQARSLGTKLLGVGVGETIFTQKRYQGLWWGPERIWMGDLVRLKMARYQLAPDGAEMIKKPSGHGKSAKSNSSNITTTLDDLLRKHSNDQPAPLAGGQVKAASNLPFTTSTSGPEPSQADVRMLDAEEDDSEASSRRSLFMRIDGFFIVQVPSSNGEMHNECRMCGMIYELADDDWESDGETNSETVGSQEKTVVDANPPQLAETKGTDKAGAAGARGLAELYQKSAEKQAHLIFPANPDLLSDVPMDTSAPDSTPAHTDPIALTESTTNASLAAVEEPLVTFESNSSISTPSSAPAASSSSAIATMAATTTTTTVTASTPPSSAPPATQTSNSSSVPSDVTLSGPASQIIHTHPLPPAPSHLRFRPVLSAGHEAVLPLTLLSGRYYPDLLSNPLLAPRVAAALRDTLSSPPAPSAESGPEAQTQTGAPAPPSGPQAHAPLWALAGLYSGAYNAVDAFMFLPSRVRMVREAEHVAWAELTAFWRSQVEQRKATIIID